MNILIIGSGAREQAIANALHCSSHHPHIFCCGTSINPGIKHMAYQYWTGDIHDVEKILQLAKTWQIDIAIIGPERPLAEGLADHLWQACIPTIGPKAVLAQIESSKIFARELMKKYRIAGLPRFAIFDAACDRRHLLSYLKELGENEYVIKADGLNSGKGVKVGGDHLTSFQEASSFCEEIFAHHQTVLVEEKLIGQEFSLMCFCDGKTIVPMPLVQDHKRAYEGDQGPNTGGMGSYSNIDHGLPFLTHREIREAITINQHVYQALMKECAEKYIGILYGSFIVTAKGIYVIEFNARFGDPEALNVLSILESDFVEICKAMITGSLDKENIRFSPLATVCKYAVPEGYPNGSIKPTIIDIAAVKNKAQLFLASVDVIDGKIVTTASRTAAYVGIAESISQAEAIAEKEICAILGPLYHRSDIGSDQLIEKRIDEMRKIKEISF